MEKLKRENSNNLMKNTYTKSINLFSLIKNDNIFKILNLAEKNNFNIWIVGGALRDFFLKKNINDFDFVHDIQPLELVEILKSNKLDFISSYINFGVIIIKLNNKKYTLTSLREDFKQDEMNSRLGERGMMPGTSVFSGRNGPLQNVVLDMTPLSTRVISKDKNKLK